MQAACAEPTLISDPSRRRTRRAVMASAAIVLSATGCFSDRGVAIEIHVGDTGATLVELYVGKERCEDLRDKTDIDCTGIAPPRTPTILKGKVFFRDTAARYTADVKGRTATFHLQADRTMTLPIVIAVGSAKTGEQLSPVATATLLDLEVPAGDARVVKATLVDADQVAQAPDDPRTVSEDRVAVWAQEVATSACVAVEHWRNALEPARAFIVPFDDPDCDELTASSTIADCNPAAYLGSSLSGGAAPKLDCATGKDGACALGNQACIDGKGTEPTCLAPTDAPICVPSRFCNCPTLEKSCLETELDAPLDPAPRVLCEVPMTMDGKPCPTDEARSAVIDLSAHFPDATCEPAIGGLVGGFARSHDFGGAVLEVNTVEPTCKVPLKWTGGERPVLGGDDRGALVLKTPDGGAVMPLILKFLVDACAVPAKCTLLDDPNDSMWSCVQ